MFGKSPAEKAFYRDMLAHGIPVVDDLNVLDLYDMAQAGAVDLDFYDVELVENNLHFSTTDGVHCITLKKEITEEGTKLIFYTPAFDTAFDNAQVIGRILLLVVTFCSTKQWLNINTTIGKPIEESYEFDSDFV